MIRRLSVPNKFRSTNLNTLTGGQTIRTTSTRNHNSPVSNPPPAMNHPVHNAYSYTNPNGSKYFSNADGSKFYDPGPNKVGRKWYQSPDGVKHYIDEARPMGYEEEFMAQHGGNHARVKYENDYDSDDTDPVFNEPGKKGLNDDVNLVRPKQTGIRTGGAPGQMS